MKRKVVAISISSALILLSAILIFYESEPGRSSDPPTDRERQKNVEPLASTPPIPTDSKPVVEVKAGKPERPELVLEPAYRLTVTVREAEGSLLAGVEVAVSEERTDPALRNAALLAPGPPWCSYGAAWNLLVSNT